jgi:hypothetical protein
LEQTKNDKGAHGAPVEIDNRKIPGSSPSLVRMDGNVPVFAIFKSDGTPAKGYDGKIL